MNVTYHVNKQEQITKLEQKGWAVFNTMYNIFKKYELNTVDQLFQMPEIIQLKAELQEIKDKIAKLK